MNLLRKQLFIKGIVQGVGFRPFVFQLAKRYQLSGFVKNDTQGVCIEVEGCEESIESFLKTIKQSPPSSARIDSIHCIRKATCSDKEFTIEKSKVSSLTGALIPPDLAVCKVCLSEILDPNNRRYRYPFTHCTDCGPRFTITTALPYDRKNTTMKDFPLCKECQEEYQDPRSRRFHTEPIACQNCGPHLELWNNQGEVLSKHEEALVKSANILKKGSIIALKGVGGFQLLVDANNSKAIERLRVKKSRIEKPFAVMLSSIKEVEKYCEVTPTEKELLFSKEAPIVLLRSKNKLSSQVAPGNPYLGVMLPYSPIHFLLLNEVNLPLIATSGNRSGEPITMENKEALDRLGNFVDYFLVHNRTIAHHADDSIVRVINKKKVVLRRARGYSSIPLKIDKELPDFLAVGGHLKNSVAVSSEKTIFTSQYIGDLNTQNSLDRASHAIDHLLESHGIDPEVIVRDLHPDYTSTKIAEKFDKKIVTCQHHVAHIFSCMAENKVTPPLLGVSWDGTGLGTDGKIWGGEFFTINKDYSYEHFATLFPFKLPFGEKSMKNPYLVALALLHALYGDKAFTNHKFFPFQQLSQIEKSNYRILFNKKDYFPLCSSMGRLFDGVCALLGIREKVSFEGQAAMDLEFFSEKSSTHTVYSFDYSHGVLDWRPMIRDILHEKDSGITLEEIAASFHNTLVEIIFSVANQSGYKKVLLSGGVFQNKVLTEKAFKRLSEKGFSVMTHEEIPPNDGGIAVGQLYSQLSS